MDGWMAERAQPNPFPKQMFEGSDRRTLSSFSWTNHPLTAAARTGSSQTLEVVPPPGQYLNLSSIKSVCRRFPPPCSLRFSFKTVTQTGLIRRQLQQTRGCQVTFRVLCSSDRNDILLWEPPRGGYTGLVVDKEHRSNTRRTEQVLGGTHDQAVNSPKLTFHIIYREKQLKVGFVEVSVSCLCFSWVIWCSLISFGSSVWPSKAEFRVNRKSV